jgi:hypothetical protein
MHNTQTSIHPTSEFAADLCGYTPDEIDCITIAA